MTTSGITKCRDATATVVAIECGYMIGNCANHKGEKMIARPRLNLFDTIRILEHDVDFEPYAECQPTKAAPGSLDKIRVMCERLKRGEHLHHEDDHRVLASIDLQQQMADAIQKAARDTRDVARAKREASGVTDKRVRRSFFRKKESI